MGKKKGAKAQGRAKQKQKAQKGGTPRTTPRPRGSGVQQMLLDDDWEEDAPIHFRGFAQNNASGFSLGPAQTKLRHQGISFVSAGVNAPTIQPKSEDDTECDIALGNEDDYHLDDGDIDDSLIQTNIVFDTDVESSNHGVANLNINPTTDSMEMDEDTVTTATSNIHTIGVDESSDGLPFVVDTIGDANLADALDLNHRTPKRAPSPAPSNSSEEIVLFHGRKSRSAVISDPVSQSRPSVTQPHLQKSTTQDPPAQGRTLSSTPAAVGWGAVPSKHDTSKRGSSNWTPAPAVPYWKNGKGKAITRPDLAPSAEEMRTFQELPPKQSKARFEDSLGSNVHGTEESIKTLQCDSKEPPYGKDGKTSKAGSQKLDRSSGPMKSRHQSSSRREDNRVLREALVSDDEASEAAYEDYMNNIKAQLEGVGEGEEEAIIATLKASGHITGSSLVVDGMEIGDDEVLPQRTRKEKASIELVDNSEWESDDDELNPDFDERSSEESLNASNLEDSDLEDVLEYTERQQWEDEEDLRQRRIERMSDEQLARLLEKQQELGIDADQLLIEDGNYMSGSDHGYGDVSAARAGLSEISNLSSTRRANKHGIRRRGDRKQNFPNASAFADTLDQYGENGFDIMDFDRPSLRPTKKGRKGKLPPELEMLSDDELKDDMANQWAKDRAKKSQKKLEREELRAFGLLGAASRKGKPDLQAKYPMGMDMRQVHHEVRAFLQDEDLRERAFPPMDKSNRKALHEIAVALNLNSKSQGAGRSRFPIIYKTSRTGEYSDDVFVKILQASTRGFLSNQRTARKFAKKGGLKGPGGGRGGSVAAAGVRHGDVVGAGAAEISQDSFGHKMMLKMGWTKGKALGKDGEGLLVPVEQRIRVGTAGLG